MNRFTRFLRAAIILLSLISIVVGILNLLTVNDTLWLFIGVGFIWLYVLLKIVEKNMPEESYR
jgi:hypothetical protein